VIWVFRKIKISTDQKF